MWLTVHAREDALEEQPIAQRRKLLVIHLGPAGVRWVLPGNNGLQITIDDPGRRIERCVIRGARRTVDSDEVAADEQISSVVHQYNGVNGPADVVRESALEASAADGVDL